MAYILKNTTAEGPVAPILRAALQNSTEPGNGWGAQTRNKQDLVTQLVISISLGLVAFFSFCVCCGDFSSSHPLSFHPTDMYANSYSGLNGPSSMLRDASDEMRPLHCPIFLIRCSAGFRFCIK